MVISAVIRPRWLAAVTYLVYAIAGLAFAVFSPAMVEVMGEVGVLLWNFLLVGGATVALLGAVIRSYWIEIIGLPGVIVGLLVLGGMVANVGLETDAAGLAIGIAGVMVGAGVGAFGRLWEVYRIARVVSSVGRRLRDG